MFSDLVLEHYELVIHQQAPDMQLHELVLHPRALILQLQELIPHPRALILHPQTRILQPQALILQIVQSQALSENKMNTALAPKPPESRMHNDSSIASDDVQSKERVLFIGTRFSNLSVTPQWIRR